ncbi:hypothetical protein D3C73_1119450 [compost metagenome]
MPALLRWLTPPIPFCTASARPVVAVGRGAAGSTTPPNVPDAMFEMRIVLAEVSPTTSPADEPVEVPSRLASIRPKLVKVALLPVRLMAVPPTVGSTPTVAPASTVTLSMLALLAKLGAPGLAAPVHVTVTPATVHAACTAALTPVNPNASASPAA